MNREQLIHLIKEEFDKEKEKRTGDGLNPFLALMLSFAYWYPDENNLEVTQFFDYLDKNLLTILRNRAEYKPNNFQELIYKNYETLLVYSRKAIEYEKKTAFHLPRSCTLPFIHLAAKNQDMPLIIKLVTEGGDINLLNSYSHVADLQTPFFCFAIAKWKWQTSFSEVEEETEKWIKLGTNIFFTDGRGYTILDFVINNRLLPLVPILLKAGITFNDKSYQYCCQQAKEYFNCNEIKKLLDIAKDADIKEIASPIKEKTQEKILEGAPKLLPVLASVITSYCLLPQLGYFSKTTNKQLFLNFEGEEKAKTPTVKKNRCAIQ